MGRCGCCNKVMRYTYSQTMNQYFYTCKRCKTRIYLNDLKLILVEDIKTQIIKIFVIDIFLMIISVLFSRHAIYNFYTDETMIFGMAILVGNVLVLALLLTSFIRTHLCNTKFEALSGKKVAFFADKAYFSKRIHNTEIEILNVQKYIISAELLLTDIDNIKNNKFLAE